MFKVRDLKTNEILDVYHTERIKDIMMFLTYMEGRWKFIFANQCEPYNPLGDFVVGQHYKYLAGFNNYDYVEIKEIKGDFAKVHSSTINDCIIVELDELIREDFNE